MRRKKKDEATEAEAKALFQAAEEAQQTDNCEKVLELFKKAATLSRQPGTRRRSQYFGLCLPRFVS